jgi:PEP-CTERM motif
MSGYLGVQGNRPRVIKYLLFLAILSVFATPVIASGISACPVSPTSGTLNDYQPPASTNGCTAGNFQFSNFNVGSDAGETIGTTTLVNSLTNSHGDTVTIPTPSQIAITSGGGNLLQFFAAAPFTTPTFCGASSGSGGYCIQGENLSVASDFTYTITDLSGTFNTLLVGSTVEVHSSGSGVTSGATAVVFEEICPGVTTFSQGCAGYQFLQVGVFNAKFQTLSGSGSAVFSPTSVAAIRDTVYLLTNNGEGSFADLQFFTIDAPEPATIGMVGFSLIGLGCMKFRRRRRKA